MVKVKTFNVMRDQAGFFTIVNVISEVELKDDTSLFFLAKSLDLTIYHRGDLSWFSHYLDHDTQRFVEWIYV